MTIAPLNGDVNVKMYLVLAPGFTHEIITVSQLESHQLLKEYCLDYQRALLFEECE